MLGEKLRSLRLLKQLTQEQTARKANLSYRYLQTIEAGNAYPTILTLFKLSRALEIDPEQVIQPVWDLWLASMNTADTDKQE